MAVNTNDKLISLTQLSTALIKVNNNLANVASEASSNISTIYDRIGYKYLGEFTLLSSEWKIAYEEFQSVFFEDHGLNNWIHIQFREPFRTYYAISIPVDQNAPYECNDNETDSENFWTGPNNYIIVDALFDQSDYDVLEEAELFNMTESHRSTIGGLGNPSIVIILFAKRAPTADVKVKLYRHYVNNRNT